MPRTHKRFALIFAVCLSLAACSPSTPPTVTAVGSLLIDVLLEFASSSIPLKKFGRAASVLSISAGKAVLKIETEMGKNGIKVGGTLPIYDLRAAVIEAYSQTNGKPPPPDFEFKNVQSALVVVRGAERFFFFLDSASFCVANVNEPAIVNVDHDKRLVFLEVDDEVTDVQFGTTDSACAQIKTEIESRKQQQAIAQLHNSMKLLGLEDSVVSVNPQTGIVEIEYRQGDSSVRANFAPDLLRAKYGINTNYDLRVFNQVAQSKIDFCSEAALSAEGNDTNSLLLARAACLSKEGFNDNDQTFFKATRMLAI